MHIRDTTTPYTKRHKLMEYDIIEDIELMLRSAFGYGESISLHEICWTIDAKHKLIPSVKELNHAVKNVGGVTILRKKDSIEIRKGSLEQFDDITEHDLDLAMDIYNRNIDKILGKRKK